LIEDRPRIKVIKQVKGMTLGGKQLCCCSIISVEEIFLYLLLKKQSRVNIVETCIVRALGGWTGYR
jgi:hypothetical protein